MEEKPGRQRSLVAAINYELRRKGTPLERWLIFPVALAIFGVLIGLSALGINVLPTGQHVTLGEAAAVGAATSVVLIFLTRIAAYAIERARRRTRPQ
jgi:ABC-type proline/glycine betaine transport system permease subunit